MSTLETQKRLGILARDLQWPVSREVKEIQLALDDQIRSEMGCCMYVFYRTGLQTTDEVPVDAFGKKFCFLVQLLRVVLAEVGYWTRSLMEGKDVIRWLEL